MRSRSVSCLSLLAAAIAAGSAAAQPEELSIVLDRIASSAGVEADFRERKEIALLAAPLESRGVIYFAPPERFARFTTDPESSALIVGPDEIRLRESPDAPEVDLSGNRVARVIVENIVVLWRGDRERLEELYAAEFSGDAERWEIRLTPRDPRLARVIEAIELRGDAAGMSEMTVRERDGDRTVTTFENVDSDRTFAPDEIDRIFDAGQPLTPPAAAD